MVLVAVVVGNLQEPEVLAIRQTQHLTKENLVEMDSVRQAPTVVVAGVVQAKSVQMALKGLVVMAETELRHLSRGHL